MYLRKSKSSCIITSERRQIKREEQFRVFSSHDSCNVACRLIQNFFNYKLNDSIIITH